MNLSTSELHNILLPYSNGEISFGAAKTRINKVLKAKQNEIIAALKEDIRVLTEDANRMELFIETSDLWDDYVRGDWEE